MPDAPAAASGEAGLMGPPGSSDSGPQGAAGLPGPQGPTGPPGTRGNRNVWLDTAATSSVTAAYTGGMYIQQTTSGSDTTCTVYQLTASNTWTRFAQFPCN